MPTPLLGFAPPPGLPPASDLALALARACITTTPVLGYARIAYQPPGTPPGGPDLLYRAGANKAAAADEAEHLARLLAPLVDLGLARGRTEVRLGRGWTPDGPGDEPPRLGAEVADRIEDNDGEVG